ncbi:hypothetical protein AWC38_SpisGene24350, partial [Stylophora pistillata]
TSTSVLKTATTAAIELPLVIILRDHSSALVNQDSGVTETIAQTVQNFACRIVSGRRKYDHVSPTLKELRWLPVKEHLYYRDAVMSFKCLTGCAPGYLSTQFISVTSQIVEREVIKCLTYLALEQQVAKGPFCIEQLLYGIPYLTIFNFVNRLMCLNATLGLASEGTFSVVEYLRSSNQNIPAKASFKAVSTNLNASGRIGPTTLGSHYTGQDHDRQVTLSSGVQQWTVPYTGDYRMKAIAAAGGYDICANSTQYRGRGAKMTGSATKYRGRGVRTIGTFRLNKGEVIQILVDQEGGINTLDYSSGGGGGTFVIGMLTVDLGLSGSRGSKTKQFIQLGGGGGGFYSSGRSGTNFNGTKGSGGEGGKGFIQGGVGGRAKYNDVDGGFGGGGGAYGLRGGGGGGGGGGYSWGSSGNDGRDTCGGGGGSYNDGNNQDNECCYNNAGHGQVTITFLE